MKNETEFWNKHAQKYAAAPIRDQASYAHTLDRTKSYLSADSRVIEIGCGTGTTALRLAGQTDHYTGTDISPKMIDIARQKAKAAACSNLDFATANAADALATDARVNVVLAFNVLHLTTGLDALIGRIHAALPAGGLFISKTACLAEPSIGLKRFAFAGLIPVMQAMGLAPYVARLRFADLEARMRTAGFEIDETGSFPAMSRFIVARKP